MSFFLTGCLSMSSATVRTPSSLKAVNSGPQNSCRILLLCAPLAYSLYSASTMLLATLCLVRLATRPSKALRMAARCSLVPYFNSLETKKWP